MLTSSLIPETTPREKIFGQTSHLNGLLIPFLSCRCHQLHAVFVSTCWRSKPKTYNSLHLCAVQSDQICSTSIAVWMQPLVFASPSLSSPPLPSPPLGSLYLYPFQSEGSQSVSDLSSLIPTFKPPALKSLFDITGELGFPPLYLSAGEDPPKSHLALLGKHSPPLLLLRNTLRALLDVWGVSFQIFLLQIAAWKLSAIFGPFT